MKNLLQIKFSEDPYKTKLICTYPQSLVEGNTWNDTYWGVCNGIGDNNLGKLLMQVRDQLQEQN